MPKNKSNSRWDSRFGFDKEKPGWIPYEERTTEQKEVHNKVMMDSPFVWDILSDDGTPETCLFAQLELKHLKRLLDRILQLIGSCVGAAAASAYMRASIGDIEYSGDLEDVKACFPWSTWGKGRQLGGLRGRGEGSFGAAQARAISQWGQIAYDDPRLPQPTISNGWMQWSKQVEYEYSWPPQWPVKLGDDEADDYLITQVPKIRTPNEAATLFAKGYSGTIACMFGTRGPRLKKGVMIADWDDSWSHQQEIAGFFTHPDLGRCWRIHNQWGRRAHPACPYIQSLIQKWCEAYGITTVPVEEGSYSVLESTFARMLQDEGFGHHSTKGFNPRKNLKWGDRWGL